MDSITNYYAAAVEVQQPGGPILKIMLMLMLKIQSLHVDVEGKGVGAVKEVVAGVEVDQEQDAD